MIAFRTARLFLFILLLLGISSCGSDNNSTSFATPTGTGYLRKSDTLWIVNLEGSYTDMGREYGALLKNELHDLYKKMDSAIGYEFAKGANPANMDYIALMKINMDDREKRLLEGMAMETDLTFDQHEFLNASLMFMYLPGCSAFAATGDQTESGSTIAGRNFDNPIGADGKYAGALKGKSILVIYNPKGEYHGTHGDNSVAAMTQIGWVYGLTNLNSQGIYLEYNNGTNSIPIANDLINILKTTTDGLHQNLYAAFDCDTLEQVNDKLSDPVAIATLTQVADKSRAWHYERSPYEKSRLIPAGAARGAYFYDNPDNMDIITNHFFYDNWQNQKFLDMTTTTSTTFIRLQNLQAQAKHYAGKINIENMKKIMTTRIADGGPFVDWGVEKNDVTHFTSVTDIANKVIHIYPNVDANPQTDGYAVKWTTIDLKNEFR
jgi:hypothetical protein